jgi:type IV secretory pathway VirB2 component (pilin)
MNKIKRKNRIKKTIVPAIFLLAVIPYLASAASSASTSTVFSNPLSWDTVQEVLASLLFNLQGIIITLAILFIVIGGIMYISSSGDETRIKRAKAVITGACLGLAIALAGPSFLREIRSILGATDYSPVDDALSLSEIITRILEFLLSILGIIAIIILVISGVMYMTSGGMEERMKTAKRMATYAVIGITIALGSLVIVKQIASFIDAGSV